MSRKTLGKRETFGDFFWGGTEATQFSSFFNLHLTTLPLRMGGLGDSRRSEFSRILHACTLSAQTPAAISPIFIPTLSPQKNPLKKSFLILSFLTLELCTETHPHGGERTFYVSFPFPLLSFLCEKNANPNGEEDQPTLLSFIPFIRGAKTF